MRIVCERHHDIARVQLLWGSSGAQVPEAGIAMLTRLLLEPEVKGVLLVLDEADGVSGATDSPHLLEEKALVDRLVRLLEEETVPSAAALSCPNNRSASRIAAACHFRFVRGAGDTASPATRAEEHLHGLLERRPPHVVRSVMRSIHNGRVLSTADALMRETQLFCELSARNETTKIRGRKS